jgi:hypothetical protein
VDNWLQRHAEGEAYPFAAPPADGAHNHPYQATFQLTISGTGSELDGPYKLTLLVEPAGSALLLPKPATVHDPKPVSFTYNPSNSNAAQFYLPS